MKRFIAILGLFVAIIANQALAQTVFSLNKPADWNNWPKQFQLDMEGIVEKAFYEFKADVKITLTGDGKIDKLITCRFPQRDNYEQVDPSKWSFVDSVKVTDKTGEYRFRAQTESWSANDTTKQFISGSKRILWENFVLFKELPTKGKFRLEFNNVKIVNGAGTELSANKSFYYEVDFSGIDTVVVQDTTAKDSVYLDLKKINTTLNFDSASKDKYGKASLELYAMSNSNKNVIVDSLSIIITTKPEINLSSINLTPALSFVVEKFDSSYAGDKYRIKVVGKIDFNNQKLANINLIFVDLQNKGIEFRLDSIKIWKADKQIAKSNFSSVVLDGSEVYKKNIFKKGDVDEHFGNGVLDQKDLDIFTKYFTGNLKEPMTYYRMWAMDYNNDGVISLADYEAMKKIVGTSSVDEVVLNAKVYPSPSFGKVCIEGDDFTGCELVIFDMNGRFIQCDYDIVNNKIIVNLKESGQFNIVITKSDGLKFIGKIINI